MGSRHMRCGDKYKLHYLDSLRTRRKTERRITSCTTW